MKKSRWLFILVIFIGLIEARLHAKPYEHIPRQDEIYLDEISANFIQEVSDEFGLLVEAYGGSMPEKIEKINLRFRSNKKTSIDEARWLLISLMQRLAEQINQDEKIRPFLVEYPFPATRANISINFLKTSLDELNTVDFVLTGRNKVFYCKFDQEEEYEDLLVESFDDALKAHKEINLKRE